MMFIDGAATSTEGDDRDHQAEADQEHGDGEDGVIVEVKILSPCNLDDNTSNDDDAPQHLEIKLLYHYSAFSDKT